MAFISRKWRWALGLGLGLALVVGAYALAGFVVAPYFVQAKVWPALSASLGGQFRATRMVFNPFRLALAVDGFALDGPDGQAVARIAEARVALAAGPSLRRRALVVEAALSGPTVQVRIDRQGHPNVAFLGGSEPPQETPSKPFPFLLAELTIEQGRLEFDDQSKGQSVKKTFSVQAKLHNLGTVADGPARFQIDAQGEGQERLAASGEWHLDKPVFQGELKLDDAKLAALAAWLLPAPYSAAGTLSLSLACRYAPETGWEVSAAEARFKSARLAEGALRLFDAESANAEGFGFDEKAGRIALRSLSVAKLQLDPSWAGFAAESASAEGFSFQTQTGRIALQSLSAAKLRLNPSLAGIAAESAKAEGFDFQTQNGQIALQSLSADKLKLDAGASLAAMLDADSANVQGFSFQPQSGQAALQSLSAAKVKLDSNARPLAEIADVSAAGLGFAAAEGALAAEHLGLVQIDLKTPSPLLDGQGRPRPSRVGALAVDGLTVNPAKRLIQLGGVVAKDSVLAAWLERDGTPGFAGLPKMAADPPGPPGPKPAAAPWQVRLGRMELNNNNLALRDFSRDPPAAIDFAPMNVLVKEYDSAAAQPFWLGMNTGLTANGRIALEGQARLSPPTANLKLYVDDLSLPPLQSYLDKSVRVRIVQGMLNLNADIDYEAASRPQLRVGGDVAVANFASIDKRESRDFINWKGLRLDGLLFESDTPRLSIRNVAVAEPYVRAILGPDKRFNLAENLSPPAQAPAARPGKGGESLAVVIGAFNISRGNVDFADLDIKPTPFAAEIHELNGNIRSLSSRADIKSDVLLEGKLNEGSAVKIFGKANPFSLMAYTDITMRFNGVNLAALSPYAAKFAGYRIEKGKLDMDLRYKLEGGRLTADNNFVLHQLQLGERVESPEATSLPINLAVSLLKDGDGKIDIDLPITGDLGNPEISIRGLLAAAAGTLVQKLIASPFTLLGSLAGSQAEDLDAVVFGPGSTTLSSQEKDQLAVVAKALQARPALNLEIKGAADPALDGPALASLGLARQLKNVKRIELGRQKGNAADWDGALSDAEYRRLLTNLYRWRNPGAPELQGLKPGDALGAAQFDNAQRKLLEDMPVSDMDLRGLAQARSASVRNYLVQDLGLADQRIYLSDVKIGAKEGKEIAVMLSISGS
jgi:hypothetical protein